MKTKVLLVILSFLFLISCCSCANQNVPQSGKLTLYIAQDETFWMDSVDVFKEENPDADIEIVSFKTNEELETRLAAEIPAGGGPDVVLWCAYTSGFDMNRMAKAGSFLALDELIAQDETYRPELYFQPVLECGVIGGKQYIIPTAFHFPTIITTQEVFDNTGLSTLKNITMHDYLNAANAEYERLKDESDKAGHVYAFGGGFSDMILYSGILSFDYAQGTILIDRDKFEQFTDYYKALERDQSKSMSMPISSFKPGDFSEKFSFMLSDFDPLSSLGSYCDGYLQYNHTPVYFGVDDYDGEVGRIVNAGLELAINKNTKSPELAYAFIRSVMDGPMHPIYKRVGKGLACCYSVNRSVCTYYLSDTASKAGYKGNYGKYMFPGINETLEHIGACRYRALDVAYILSDSFKPYFDDEKDFDACYDAMLNSLTLYITE